MAGWRAWPFAATAKPARSSRAPARTRVASITKYVPEPVFTRHRQLRPDDRCPGVALPSSVRRWFSSRRRQLGPQRLLGGPAEPGPFRQSRLCSVLVAVSVRELHLGWITTDGRWQRPDTCLIFPNRHSVSPCPDVWTIALNSGRIVRRAVGTGRGRSTPDWSSRAASR